MRESFIDHVSKNCILVLAVTAVNMLIMGICFDFYYDLNDDTMMLDIMSGAYSGVPDGHNMQTLYPLGALIALCYRICGGIPWYGLFLCLCQFGCFYLIGMRLCVLVQRTGKDSTGGPYRKRDLVKKVSLLLLLSLFVWGLCLAHVMNIQYTVTCAVLSAAAIFLFLTTPDTDNGRQFVIRNIPSMALVILAYQLRSEMLLLTFPFICLAGLYRLTEEKQIFVKENLFRYGGVLGIMLAGMLLSRGADYMAYGSAAWKDFLRFFEARTTVYDFYPELITEDAYQDALTRLGVAPYQQTLLRNYDYGLDEEIDTELLTELAEYATHTLGPARDWGGIFRKQVYRYYDRMLRGGDGAYSRMLLWMYVAVLAAGCSVRYGSRKEENVPASGGSGVCRYAFVWQILLLAVVRSAIWMFILLRGRDPERITHSLYVAEAALLLGMLCIQLMKGNWIRFRETGEEQPGSRRRGASVIFMLLGLLCICHIPHSVRKVMADEESREISHVNCMKIAQYCGAHPDNFYFKDVYSTVGYSQRIFRDVDNSLANHDIMGGWVCKSPLYDEKLEKFGITTMEEGLLRQDNVFFVTSKDSDTSWLTAYYAGKGFTVGIEEVDSIEETYAVYQLKELGD